MNNLTVLELREKVLKKEISVYEVTEYFLNKTKLLQPNIKSMLYINEEAALKFAKKIDNSVASRPSFAVCPSSQLLGLVPIAIKDNICLKSTPTTCASQILKNFISPYNATVVENLKNSLTPIIAKTNLDEFAMGSSCENSGFFPTYNPWDVQRVPGGSSGGSAAAVAAGQVPWALGSDTGGSIRQPASFCGVVGLLPSYGRVSRFGLVAFASSLDQIGPLTKTVKDAALLLNIISGYDKNDSTSTNIPQENFLEDIDKDVKGLKVGIISDLIAEGIESGVREKFLQTINLLSNNKVICEEVSLPLIKYALDTYYIIAPAEASSNLARYDGVKYGLRIEAEDYISMYKKTRLSGFGEEVKRRIIIGTYTLSSGYYDAYYRKAVKVRYLIRKEFEKLFETYDCLVCPTSPTVAFKLGEKIADPLAMYLSDICTIPVNLASLPALSIPCGLSQDLPVGFQIIGKHFAEKLILRVGNFLEKEINFKLKTINYNS